MGTRVPLGCRDEGAALGRGSEGAPQPTHTGGRSLLGTHQLSPVGNPVLLHVLDSHLEITPGEYPLDPPRRGQSTPARPPTERPPHSGAPTHRQVVGDTDA